MFDHIFNDPALLGILTVDEYNFFGVCVISAVYFNKSDDPVYKRPDSAAAYGDKLKDAETDLSAAESVNTEFTESKGEKPYKKMLVISLFHNSSE